MVYHAQICTRWHSNAGQRSGKYQSHMVRGFGIELFSTCFAAFRASSATVLLFLLFRASSLAVFFSSSPFLPAPSRKPPGPREGISANFMSCGNFSVIRKYFLSHQKTCKCAVKVALNFQLVLKRWSGPPFLKYPEPGNPVSVGNSTVEINCSGNFRIAGESPVSSQEVQNQRIKPVAISFFTCMLFSIEMRIFIFSTEMRLLHYLALNVRANAISVGQPLHEPRLSLI